MSMSDMTKRKHQRIEMDSEERKTKNCCHLIDTSFKHMHLFFDSVKI